MSAKDEMDQPFDDTLEPKLLSRKPAAKKEQNYKQQFRNPSSQQAHQREWKLILLEITEE